MTTWNPPAPKLSSIEVGELQATAQFVLRTPTAPPGSVTVTVQIPVLASLDQMAEEARKLLAGWLRQAAKELDPPTEGMP